MRAHLFARNEDELVGPVVRYGVESRLRHVGALMHLGADALVHTRSIPREMIDDPEVISRVEHGRGDCTSRAQCAQIAGAAGCKYALLPIVDLTFRS